MSEQAPPLRLSALARALASAGCTPMPAGTVLNSLELVVPVASAPVLDPRRFWSIEVARPAPHDPAWKRLIARLLAVLPAALGGPKPASADPAWPMVKLTWSEGRVFASLIHSGPSNPPVPKGD